MAPPPCRATRLPMGTAQPHGLVNAPTKSFAVKIAQAIASHCSSMHIASAGGSEVVQDYVRHDNCQSELYMMTVPMCHHLSAPHSSVGTGS